MANSIDMFAIGVNTQSSLNNVSISSILFEYVGEVAIETQENHTIQMFFVFEMDGISMESILSSGMKVIVQYRKVEGEEMSSEEILRFQSDLVDRTDLLEAFKPLAVAETVLESLEQRPRLRFTLYASSYSGSSPRKIPDYKFEYVSNIFDDGQESDSLSEHKSDPIEDDEFFQKLLKKKEVLTFESAVDAGIDTKDDSLSIEDFLLTLYEKRQSHSQKQALENESTPRPIDDSNVSIVEVKPITRNLRKSTILSKKSLQRSASPNNVASTSNLISKSKAVGPTRVLDRSQSDITIVHRKLSVHDHNTAVRKYDKAWRIKSKTKFPANIAMPSYSSAKLLVSREETVDLDTSILSGPTIPAMRESTVSKGSYLEGHADESFVQWSPVAQPQPAPLKYYKA